MLGLIELNIGNQSSLQRKITMQERHFMLALLFFFLGSEAHPPSFFILESPLHTTFFVTTQLRISELPR